MDLMWETGLPTRSSVFMYIYKPGSWEYGKESADVPDLIRIKEKNRNRRNKVGKREKREG